MSEKINMHTLWHEINEEKHFWVVFRFNYMMKILNKSNLKFEKPLKVLDVGCGKGLLRKSLEAKTNWVIDCVDMDEDVIRNIIPGRGKDYVYNINDIKKDMLEKYDIVILADILEHIDETQCFLKNIKSHLVSGGCLVINVPALNCFYSKYDEVIGHLRRYSKKDLKKEVLMQKFNVVSVSYWGAILIPLLFIRKYFFCNKNKKEEEIINNGFKPNPLLNIMFSFLSKIELLININLPLGSSLLLVANKL